MSAEMEVHRTEKLDLSVDSQQTWWSDKQLAILRHLGVEGASDGDLAVFHHVCQRTGLDPFARQIYMVRRDGKQTIQTGIDGFRLVARRAVDRSGESLSIDSAEWCGEDGRWTDVWLSADPPAAARVKVHRGTGTFTAVALWREYVQTKRDGEVNRMWSTRPAGQIAKCAEVLALRRAFPQDLSSVYSDDEMGQADQPSRRPAVVGRGTVTAEQVLGIASQVDTTTGEVTQHDADTDLTSAADSTPEPISDRQSKALHASMSDLGITERSDKLKYAIAVVGRDITTSSDLTYDEASAVLDALRDDLAKASTQADADAGKDPWAEQPERTA